MNENSVKLSAKPKSVKWSFYFLVMSFVIFAFGYIVNILYFHSPQAVHDAAMMCFFTAIILFVLLTQFQQIWSGRCVFKWTYTFSVLLITIFYLIMITAQVTLTIPLNDDTTHTAKLFTAVYGGLQALLLILSIICLYLSSSKNWFLNCKKIKKGITINNNETINKRTLSEAELISMRPAEIKKSLLIFILGVTTLTIIHLFCYLYEFRSTPYLQNTNKLVAIWLVVLVIVLIRMYREKTSLLRGREKARKLFLLVLAFISILLMVNLLAPFTSVTAKQLNGMTQSAHIKLVWMNFYHSLGMILFFIYGAFIFTRKKVKEWYAQCSANRKL